MTQAGRDQPDLLVDKTTFADPFQSNCSECVVFWI